MSLTKINIGNVLVDNVTMQEALDAIEGFIVKGVVCYMTSLNVDMVIKYNRDVEFANYYNDSALCMADGMPIMWAARFLGTPLKEKVSGSDLVPRVCKLSNDKGYKIFFLGGRPGAAEAAKNKLYKDLIYLKVVGTYSPPFGFERDETELNKIIHMVKEARPDILLVGLGAPKQERWIKQYCMELGVPVCMGVGATFEFIAGVVKRAPIWVQRIGMEWFWRFCMEPGRLWKRYWVDDMGFWGLILRQKFMNKNLLQK